MDQDNIEEFIRLFSIQIARIEEKNIASEKALALFAESMKTWQANANEWRLTIQDLSDKFVAKEAYSIEYNSIEDRVTKLEKLQQQNAGRGGAFHSVWIVVVAIVGWGITIASVVWKAFAGGK